MYGRIRQFIGEVRPESFAVAPLIPAGTYRACGGQKIQTDASASEGKTDLLELMMSVVLAQRVKREANLLGDLEWRVQNCCGP